MPLPDSEFQGICRAFGLDAVANKLHADPQVVANQTLVKSDHPRAGRLREPRPAPRFTRTPAPVGGAAPDLGQHTDEILSQLGLADEIETLRRDGIVA